MTKLNAGSVAITLVFGQLPGMMISDAVAREVERVEGLLRASCNCRFDLGRCHAQAKLTQIHGIEFQRQCDQRLVAGRAHICNDRGNRLIDICGNFALLRQQRLERGLKIFVAGFQAHRHCTFSNCGRSGPRLY